MTTIHVGDCREVMATLEPESIDAIVCDPPYGLEFMGKEWDKLGAVIEHPDDGEGPWGRTNRVRYGSSAKSMQSWHESWAIEAYRVLKPGGHLLAFGGTRTVHRLACAIEDAGFEIRDQVVWMYGSGFPKSLDVSKAIDKAAGAEREVVAKYARPDGTDRDYTDWSINSGEWKDGSGFDPSKRDITAPATPDAERWQGWGTALKPAHEPVVVARKPLGERTVARNVLTHGTGALNVDGCRIGTDAVGARSSNTDGIARRSLAFGMSEFDGNPTLGRWPANVVLDEDAAAMLDAQSGERSSRPEVHADFGGMGKVGSGFNEVVHGAAPQHQNHHPTVKPVALMRWLIRLVTPPGGIVLDPFLGSGTTGIAAALEGVRFVGIEQSPEYAEIARRRIEHAAMCPAEFIAADDPEPVEYDGAKSGRTVYSGGRNHTLTRCPEHDEPIGERNAYKCGCPIAYAKGDLPVVRTPHGELQIALPMFTAAAD
jgi:DNA modification methylase